ncbi:MAG: hypothetical protein ABGZ53_27565 [Fuerstiella sp.]
MWQHSDRLKIGVLAALAGCLAISVVWRTAAQPQSSQHDNRPVFLRAVGREFRWYFESAISPDSPVGSQIVQLGNEVVLPPETNVTIELLSDDYVYFLQVDELNIKEVVVPGMVHTVEFRTPSQGQFDFESSPLCGFLAYHSPRMGRLSVR